MFYLNKRRYLRIDGVCNPEVNLGRTVARTVFNKNDAALLLIVAGLADETTSNAEPKSRRDRHKQKNRERDRNCLGHDDDDVG